MRATTIKGRVVHDFKIICLNIEYATSACGNVHARKMLTRWKPDEPVTCRKCLISMARAKARNITLFA